MLTLPFSSLQAAAAVRKHARAPEKRERERERERDMASEKGWTNSASPLESERDIGPGVAEFPKKSLSPDILYFHSRTCVTYFSQYRGWFYAEPRKSRVVFLFWTQVAVSRNSYSIMKNMVSVQQNHLMH